MTLGDMIVRVGADTKDFVLGMGDVNKQIGAVEREVQRGVGNIEKISGQLSQIGMGLTAAVTLPIVGLGAAALEAAAKMETAQTAFTTMMKSETAAVQHLQELRAFALSTPFQFTELIDASRKMQALGFSAQEVVPKLRTIGNAVSALGGGNEMLQRVILSLGQMQQRGRITGEELRELAHSGVPALQAIADKLGVTTAQAQKMIKEGSVDAKVAMDAILSYMDGRFKGGMEKQAQTLAGIFSNIKDAIGFTLADIGKVLAPTAKTMMTDVFMPILDATKSMAAGFAALPTPIQNTIVATTLLLAALGPVLLIIGSIGSSLVTIISGWAAVKVAMMAVSGAFSSFLAIGGASLLLYGSLTVAVGYLAVKLLGLADAEDASNKASVGYGQQRQKLIAYLNSQGVATTDLIAKFNAHKITSDELDKELQKLALTLGKTKTATTSVDDAAAKLGFKTTRQLTEELKAAKEELVKINQAYVAGAASADDLARAKEKVRLMSEMLHPSLKKEEEALVVVNLQDRLNWEAQERNQAAYKKTIGIIVDNLSVWEDWGKKIEYVTARSMELNQATINYQRDLAAVSREIQMMPMPNWSKVKDGMQEVIRISGGADQTQAGREAAAEKAKRDWQEMIVLQQKGAASVEDVVRAQDAWQEAVKRTKTGNDELSASGKTLEKTWTAFGKQVSTIFTDAGKKIADLIVDGGSLKEIFVGAAKEIEKAFLRMIIESAIKQAMKWVGKLMDQLSQLGGILGKIFGKIGGVLSGGAGSAGGIAGGASGAGGAAGGIGGAVGGSIAGVVGAVGSVVGAISGVIGNFQASETNKTLDRIVLHTLQTANDLANLRRDDWDREAHLMHKLDDMWQTILDFKDGMFHRMDAGVGVAGGLTLQINGGYFLSSRAMDDFTEEFIKRLKQRGVL